MTERISKLQELQPRQLMQVAFRRLECRNFSELAQWLGYNKSSISRWWQTQNLESNARSLLELIWLMDNPKQIELFKGKMENRFDKSLKALRVTSKRDLYIMIGVMSNNGFGHHYHRIYDALECLTHQNVEELALHRGVLIN